MSNSTTDLNNYLATETISYLGYRYEPEVMEEDDCHKILHTVIYEKTGRVAGHIDHSPYSTPTEEKIRQAIEFWAESHAEQVANDILPECYEPKATNVEALKEALCRAEYEVERTTPKVQRGSKAIAYRGRKVPVGTVVEVFWVGDKRNPFSNAIEKRAGVILPDGSKTFVDAHNLDPVPTEAEMKAHGEAVRALKAAQKAMRAVDPSLV